MLSKYTKNFNFFIKRSTNYSTQFYCSNFITYNFLILDFFFHMCIQPFIYTENLLDVFNDITMAIGVI